MNPSHVLRAGARVIGYRASRTLGWPLPMPINLAIVPTGRCNSRCRTCNIWRTPAGNELDVREWDMIFRSMGKTHPWVTASEGEPFLSESLVDIMRSLVEHNDPVFIVIPTNGTLSCKIESDVRDILSFYKRELIINFSLDGLREDHDYIRGIEGNFDALLESISAVRNLKKGNRNLRLGINTVISRHNAHLIGEISRFVRDEIRPDSHIFEIADNRAALHNQGMKLKPDSRAYLGAVKKAPRGSRRNVTYFFRNRYYSLVRDMLRKGGLAVPCYAGIASAQISSTGEVWACCRMCESMGSLRDNGYDFRKVWKSSQAQRVRERIKRDGCWCTSANANYTNLLCSPMRMVLP